MTPAERWLAVLSGETPDRLPMDYWATPEVDRRLMRDLGCATMSDVYRRLHIDKVFTVGPRYVGPAVPAGYDMYGVGYREVRYETGVYRERVSHPLARYERVDAISAEYRWPSVDWFDYSVIPEQVKRAGEYPIRGGGSEPFLTYCSLRGLDQAMVDLVLNPEIVHYCLDRLFDFCYENTRRIYEQATGRVIFSYIAEDMGSQSNLLFSPEHIRTFLLPRMKRMIDLAHQADVYVFHHNDGAIRAILPELIEAGIDILNPIQWRCAGMERDDLKADFGDLVVFHGGVDNQQTLSFGSTDDVRDEVIENIRILGSGGGYILAPCHNIQAVSPTENIVTMYETGFAHG